MKELQILRLFFLYMKIELLIRKTVINFYHHYPAISYEKYEAV
jgi:hypothetical protein